MEKPRTRYVLDWDNLEWEDGSVRTRFKKGQSGNPKGRPKGSRNARTIARELAEEIMVVTINGKRRRITQQEYIVRSIFAGAMKGSPKHVAAYLKLTGQDQPEPPKPDHPTGVLVVPETCKSMVEWTLKYGSEEAKHPDNIKRLMEFEERERERHERVRQGIEDPESPSRKVAWPGRC